jgi:hypothetical protein
VTLNGQLSAIGSGFGRSGSGGALRLICNRLDGTGTVRAHNDGRIRVEANQLAFGDVGVPPYTFGLPGSTATIWPDTSIAPSVRVVSLGPAPVPIDPRASFEFPYADVNVSNGTAQTLVIEARNIPTGVNPPGIPAWDVVARVVPRGSAVFNVDASYVSGDFSLSVWHAQITLPSGFSAIQVRAAMPPP